MKNRLLIFLSCTAILLSTVLSALFVVNPALAHAYSSPGKPTGFVNDYAGVIDEASQVAMELDLQNFRDTTSNEISVVSIQSLGGDSKENYALQLAREWAIGGAEHGNGVLVLVAVDEHQIRIEVSQHLEGAITDLIASRIASTEMAPAFRAGDYAGGINAGLASLKLAAQGEYNAPPESKAYTTASNAGAFGLLFWVVLTVFVWMTSFLARSKSIVAGGVMGGIVGLFSLVFLPGLLAKVLVFIASPLLGLLLDSVVSKNYHRSISRGGNGGFFTTWGGFSGGSRGGGGFSGFGGGGSFGGGGGGSSW
jgi:uncharacterized protein